MSFAAILICGAIILIALALHELARWRSGRSPGGSADGRGRAAGRPDGWAHLAPDTALRLERAGAAGSVSTRALIGLRLTGLCAGSVTGALLMPLAPGRTGFLAALLLGAFGAFSPDLALERAGRRRRETMVEALPDAIEVLAVRAGGGGSVRSGLARLAAAGSGPLARELAIASAEIECGRAPGEALADLRRRVPIGEIRSLTAAIERSARFGSPLADQLNRQAMAARDARRRAIGERSSRAAPKMQLVIALVLVPSVLLLIAAGLVANAGALFSGL